VHDAQLGVPVVAGQTCDVGPGAALLEPFKLVILKKTGGSVNLCARTDPLVDRLTCPVGPAVIPNHHDAFASSFFKLQALWVDVAGLVVGTDYGVARQRCQVSLQTCDGGMMGGLRICLHHSLCPDMSCCVCAPSFLPLSTDRSLDCSRLATSPLWLRPRGQ
jgi:hypothetical protein